MGSLRKSNSIILLGPALSAVGGVSTHLNQILNSDLAIEFSLRHFQVGRGGDNEKLRQILWRLLWSPFALIYTIMKLEPSIIHLNTSINEKAFLRDAVYLLTAKVLGRKIIYQIHGGDFPDRFCKGKPFMVTFFKFLLRLSDAIALLSSPAKQAYEIFCPGLSPQLIPNAIDLIPYADCKPKKLNDVENIHLVYIGRLAQNKGLLEALEAIHLLKNEPFYNRLCFYMAGSGPARHALQIYSQNLGIEDKVFFLGRTFGDQKIEFWKRASIFVFPTYHREGLPYSILESLASATPIVTTRIGGIPDVIEDGVHGRFVQAHDPGGVAEAIKFLVGDEDRFKSMSEECVKTAKEYYGIDRLARQFTELYNQVLCS